MTEPSDRDVMAAEQALGLLAGDDRAAALRRQLAEPDFAREVERWRDRFAALFASIPAIEPSAALGRRIEARIDGRLSLAGRWWRPTAIVSSLAAASLLGVVLLRPDPTVGPTPAVQPTPAPLVAAFSLPGRDMPVVAVYDARAGRLTMPGPMDIPAGHDAQLWAIAGTNAPQPLGLFHAAGTDIVADAKAAAPFAPGTTFAVSIEPVGGSPTGAPTGPVIASGALSKV